tara:strand:+ start:1032 stop:1655 length:624 start_codon:yes stop_codon:yes gene_type:complete
MVFDFSNEIKSKGLKILFSNEDTDDFIVDKTEIGMNQIHSNQVKLISSDTKSIDVTDGIFTIDKNICLTIKTADCLPIFFYNKSPFIIGAIHAGWKGLKDRIIFNAYDILQKEVKSLNSIEVLIGPSISQKNYEVQKDFISYFGNEFIIELNGRYFMSLQDIAISQLNKIGIMKIKNVNQCTFENNHFHSFRRNKTKKRLKGYIYYE